ncbi:MAG: hypothetical protein Q8M07_04715, partial [Prosthecobacter sp.]|nr:hypothetical protein [Prosthecobacter sp.]
ALVENYYMTIQITINLVSSIRTMAIVTMCIVASSPDSHSAEAPSPLLPSEPHEALAFYEGTWKTSHKDRVDVEETCTWLQGGRRHIVCRARRQASDGMREALGVYSYDEARREYVYHGFGSRGDLSFEHGQRIPNGFQFFSENGEGFQRSQARFTIVESVNGKVNTLLEETKAGGPWVVVEKVEYVRTRP